MKQKQKDQERELMHPDEFFFNKPPTTNTYSEITQQARQNLLMETLMNKYKSNK